MPERYAVMDVGGSHVTAAIVEGSSVVERNELGLDPHGSADQILTTIAAAGSALGAQSSWTLAFPGPFDYPRGVGTFEGVAKFGAIAGLDLKSELGDRLGAASISFVDDADSYGMGEWLAGAAQGQSRAICITLGTGVGAAFILDGVAVGDGPGVPPGGNLYPFDYEGAPIEDTVSTRAVVAAYRHVTGETISVRELTDRARAGDDTAAQIFANAMMHLGRFLSPWIEGFGATMLVVGGSISKSWDLIEPPLRHGIGHDEVLTSRSLLLDDAPLIGAALWASRQA